jgi:2,4-dienoyl-CoA reductase-like NADH-dependent reductase (Old Yellow Enzyme family)
MTGAVGLITETHFADEIVTPGSADLVLLAREYLREPHWALKAQHDLHAEQRWPVQYGYALKRKAK